MRQTIEWLGGEPLPVFVKHSPNMFCIFNRSKSNDYAVVVVTSLCSDPFDSITLEVAPEWSNAQFEILGKNGIWEKIRVQVNENMIKFNTKVSLMDPVILKLLKS